MKRQGRLHVHAHGSALMLWRGIHDDQNSQTHEYANVAIFTIKGQNENGGWA